MRHAVSETDFLPGAKFQPNPFSSFGIDASRTDRQTNSKLDIPVYHWEIVKYCTSLFIDPKLIDGYITVP